jgi:hypothetical protein
MTALVVVSSTSATTWLAQPSIPFTSEAAALLRERRDLKADVQSIAFSLIADNVGSWRVPVFHGAESIDISALPNLGASPPADDEIGQLCHSGSNHAQIVSVQDLSPFRGDVMRCVMRHWSGPVASGSRITLHNPPLDRNDRFFVAYVVNVRGAHMLPGEIWTLYGRLYEPVEIIHPVTQQKIVVPSMIAQSPPADISDSPYIANRARAFERYRMNWIVNTASITAGIIVIPYGLFRLTRARFARRPPARGGRS